MYFVLFLIPLLLFGAWIFAELKGNLVMRITLGVLSMLTVGLGGVVIYQGGQIIPRYESGIHRSALKRLQEIAATGDAKRVDEVLRVYEQTAEESNTYAASHKLWQLVNALPKPESNSGEFGVHLSPFVAKAFGIPVVVKAEFVPKPNDYFSQNMIRTPYTLKVIAVDGVALKKEVLIEYRFESKSGEAKKLERSGVVVELEAYESLYQSPFSTPWLTDSDTGLTEQGASFALRHVLSIRPYKKPTPAVQK